jgi:hypothetical protein
MNDGITYLSGDNFLCELHVLAGKSHDVFTRRILMPVVASFLKSRAECNRKLPEHPRPAL